MPDKKLKSIIELARYAPSVHNSQPWKVRQEGELLHVSIDTKHKLRSGDPTGRETIISLGIFVEAICGAAAINGFTVKSVEFKDHAASIRILETNVRGHNNRFAELLKRRRTDRSVFRKTELNKEQMRSLRSIKSATGTEVHVSTDSKIIELTAILTSRAIRVALSDPNFRRELANYLTLPWSPKKRGISVLSLGIPPVVAVFEPLAMRLGLGLNMESSIELRRWQSASAVIFITANGDMPRFWFEAGRTYLRTSLEIERLGLSQATSAAIVEASNYHDDIEELLHTKDRILAVLRIGKGSASRHYSPRVSTDELLH